MKRNHDLMAWQFFEEETPVKVNCRKEDEADRFQFFRVSAV